MPDQYFSYHKQSFFATKTTTVWWLPFYSKSYYKQYLWLTLSWLGVELHLRFTSKKRAMIYAPNTTDTPPLDTDASNNPVHCSNCSSPQNEPHNDLTDTPANTDTPHLTQSNRHQNDSPGYDPQEFVRQSAPPNRPTPLNNPEPPRKNHTQEENPSNHC